MPASRLLIGLSECENLSLGERLTDDLYTHGKPVLRIAARDGNGRQTENIEGLDIPLLRLGELRRRPDLEPLLNRPRQMLPGRQDQQVHAGREDRRGPPSRLSQRL